MTQVRATPCRSRPHGENRGGHDGRIDHLAWTPSSKAVATVPWRPKRSSPQRAHSETRYNSKIGWQRTVDRSPMHATLDNVTQAVQAFGAGWEVSSASETRAAAVVPSLSVAGERARQIWPVVRATMSQGMSTSA